MTHQQIVDRVAKRAELPTRRTSEHVIRAVLETISQQIDHSAYRDLAERLPQETAEYLNGRHEPIKAKRRLDVDAFLDRIGGRLAMTRPDAVRVCRAVIDVLADAAGQDSVDRLRRDLPPAWGKIFEATRRYVAPPLAAPPASPPPA